MGYQAEKQHPGQLMSGSLPFNVPPCLFRSGLFTWTKKYLFWNFRVRQQLTSTTKSLKEFPQNRRAHQGLAAGGEPQREEPAARARVRGDDLPGDEPTSALNQGALA